MLIFGSGSSHTDSDLQSIVNRAFLGRGHVGNAKVGSKDEREQVNTACLPVRLIEP